jgi:PadR family transcriptional regulator, regulatory protein PadR
MGSPRITTQTLAVLSAFINSGQELAGSDLARDTKLQSGTLYPILLRLEEAGWLKSRWEVPTASELGRPRRRLYKLTGTGARAAAEELRKMAALVGGLAWGTF